MARRVKKPKPGFMDCYDRPDRQYNPTTEGFGHAAQWAAAFEDRMGRDEAEAVIGDDSPWAVLGLKAGATHDEIRKAYKKRAIECHPSSGRNAGKDSGPLHEEFKRVLAAYTLLIEGG